MEGVRDDEISRGCQKSKRWKLTRLRGTGEAREREKDNLTERLANEISRSSRRLHRNLKTII